MEHVRFKSVAQQPISTEYTRYEQVKFLKKSILLHTRWENYRSTIQEPDIQLWLFTFNQLISFKSTFFLSLCFFNPTNVSLNLFVVAETANYTLKSIFPFTELEFQISLGAGVFMQLRSCQQNVNISDICNLSLLAWGPQIPGLILKSLCRM